MRKAAIILIVALTAMTLLAGGAFAAQQNISGVGQTIGAAAGYTTTVLTSSNVNISYIAGTNGITYAIGSYHQTGGSKEYISSSGDTKVYYATGTASITLTAPTSPTATMTQPSGTWTAM